MHWITFSVAGLLLAGSLAALLALCAKTRGHGIPRRFRFRPLQSQRTVAARPFQQDPVALTGAAAPRIFPKALSGSAPRGRGKSARPGRQPAGCRHLSREKGLCHVV